MSIAKRIAEAVDKMKQRDTEGALLPVSSALDATATKHYGKRGRESYKKFIHDNLVVITKAAGFPFILNMNLQYDHPDIEAGPDGACTIQDVLYHAVRCGLAHDAELPSNLKFTDEGELRVENNLVVLASSMVYGLIVAVVGCPANTDQSVPDNYVVSIRGRHKRLNELWGNKGEVLALLEPV